MRVALIGWDVDDSMAGALASLGTDVVAFTRSVAGRPESETRGGWRVERCGCPLAEGESAPSEAFRDAVLARAAQSGAEWGGFDILHALDPGARPAALALIERHRPTVAIASVVAQDGRDETVRANWSGSWVCDHPWLLESWPDFAHRPELVPGSILATAPRLRDSARSSGVVLFWIPRAASPDPEAIARAVAEVGVACPDVAAVVLGLGPVARATRDCLERRGLRPRSDPDRDPESPEAWAQRLATATVVVTIGERLDTSPTAWRAWIEGVPVIGHDGRDPSSLARQIHETLAGPERAAREVQAGAALARVSLSAAAVARGWLGIYLAARSGVGERRMPELPIPPGIGGRSRLNLLAVAPGELYVTWHIRPDDRAIALRWLGGDAARASLTLRLHELTDHPYEGPETSLLQEIEILPFERSRRLAIDAPGRLVGARLGLKSPRGLFVPLVQAAPVDLPRSGPPEHGTPTHRLRVLPRRAVPQRVVTPGEARAGLAGSSATGYASSDP